MNERLEGFYPERVFDAHAHIGLFREQTDTAADYIRSQSSFLPDLKELRANLIPFPDPSLKEPNKLRQSVLEMKEQLDAHPGFFGEVMVLPGDSERDIEERLIHPRIRGLKCYHVYADRQNTQNADIEEYLPESAWRVADRNKMVITLHLVKSRSLSDRENMRYIKEHAAKYPNARLILAHCARGFAAWTAVESVEELNAFPNIWFDVAAVCESPAIFACIRAVGVNRVLWGSDHPISDINGKCVSFADGFIWIYEKELQVLGSAIPIRKVEEESLFALREACGMLGLSKQEINKIFYDNACALFTEA